MTTDTLHDAIADEAAAIEDLRFHLHVHQNNHKNLLTALRAKYGNLKAELVEVHDDLYQQYDEHVRAIRLLKWELEYYRVGLNTIQQELSRLHIQPVLVKDPGIPNGDDMEL